MQMYRFSIISCVVISVIVLLLVWCLRPIDTAWIFDSRERGKPSMISNPGSTAGINDWAFDSVRDGRNHGLSDEQCEIAFPGLYQELDRAKAWHQKNRPGGVITESDIDQWGGRAQLRLMIYDGQLRLLDKWGIEGPHIPDRPLATLHAIHRTIAAAPDPRRIPNVEFTIDTQDNAEGGGANDTIWGYCRSRDDEAMWVMPDFGFWSYPHPTVGSYDEFRSKVRDTEEQDGFLAKANKLVWRGAPGKGGDVRQALVDATDGKTWSDVVVLDWGNASTQLDMHQHCRYRFAAHTEGITWSGRLRYLQNCNNVVVAHKLEYIAHYYPLMISSGPDQNFVEVERDYSDLAEKMDVLLSHEEDAARIAANGAETFRDRYLTPAAESCYWRAMFRAWREVQGWEPRPFTGGGPGEGAKKRWRGVAWEKYSVTGKDWGVDAPP